MNEQFYELPEEKRMRIINAGLEVFSKNDYKRAVTDDIAVKAGISKGLLFYYFHNKKSLYMFLFEYTSNLIKDEVINRHFEEITDFFELIEYASQRKFKVLSKSPYLMDFIVRCFYPSGEPVSEELNATISQLTEGAPKEYFKNVDYSKFKEDIEPREIYNMLVWMCMGYIGEKQRRSEAISMDEMMQLFYVWEERMRRIAYKTEFQTPISDINIKHQFQTTCGGGKPEEG